MLEVSENEPLSSSSGNADSFDRSGVRRGVSVGCEELRVVGRLKMPVSGLSPGANVCRR